LTGRVEKDPITPVDQSLDHGALEPNRAPAEPSTDHLLLKGLEAARGGQPGQSLGKPRVVEEIGGGGHGLPFDPAGAACHE
jgi:hypothetical protein